LQYVRRPAAPLQGHAHVALRRDPRSAGARHHRRHLPADGARDGGEARGRGRPGRDDLPVLHREEGAGLGREEPARLRGDLHQPHSQEAGPVLQHEGGGAGHQPLPLLEENLRARRAQPALARHDHRANDRLRLDRGAGRPRRETGLVRALRPAQASRREVRHRARLRQPEVRRGPGARRRRGAQPRRAHRELRGRVGELRVDPQPQRLRPDREEQTGKVAALLFGFLATQETLSQDFVAARERMLAEIDATYAETRGETGLAAMSPAVREAMGKVERHRLVPDGQRHLAYRNHPLPIGSGQTISQPYIVALSTDLLNLKGGESVLDVGTGSGYQAAVLAEVVSRVYSIEIIPSLANEARKHL